MRVDKDWEEEIGKKLFDFEGELSPQDWNNINQRIKPRRNKRYYWLPALLFFLALPGAIYFTDFIDWRPNSGQQIAQIPAENSTDKTVTGSTQTVSVQGEKPNGDQDPDAVRFAENGIVSDEKTTATKINSNAGNVKQHAGNEPEKEHLSPALIAASRPAKPLFATEAKKRSESDESEKSIETTRNISAHSGSQHAGILAFNRTNKKQSAQALEKSASAELFQAETVAFSREKVNATSAVSGGFNDAAVIVSESSNTQAALVSSTKKVKEIGMLDLKATGLALINFPETLPDSLKKYLIATLPDPENADENEKRIQDKKPSKNWALAVYVTPNYTFQRVLPNKKDEISILKLENKNAFETERLGFETGIRGYYQVRKNLELIFGFQAACVKQHLRLQTVNTQPDSVAVQQQGNSISMQIYNSPRAENHLFSYYFGGIFTGMNLRITEKLDLSGGLGMNWLLQTRSSGERANVAGNAFNPYLNLGLQYQQPLSQKLTLTAGPSMQYYLKPVQEKQAFIGVKPTVIGFSVGMKFKP